MLVGTGIEVVMETEAQTEMKLEADPAIVTEIAVKEEDTLDVVQAKEDLEGETEEDIIEAIEDHLYSWFLQEIDDSYHLRFTSSNTNIEILNNKYHQKSMAGGLEFQFISILRRAQ